jgi:nucleoside-diphosphate-sugar epimerase
MKVLVVGGAGFVGSNLVKLLLKSYQDINIVIVDNLLSGHTKHAESEVLP